MKDCLRSGTGHVSDSVLNPGGISYGNRSGTGRGSDSTLNPGEISYGEDFLSHLETAGQPPGWQQQCEHKSGDDRSDRQHRDRRSKWDDCQ